MKTKGVDITNIDLPKDSKQSVSLFIGKVKVLCVDHGLSQQQALLRLYTEQMTRQNFNLVRDFISRTSVKFDEQILQSFFNECDHVDVFVFDEMLKIFGKFFTAVEMEKVFSMIVRHLAKFEWNPETSYQMLKLREDHPKIALSERDHEDFVSFVVRSQDKFNQDNDLQMRKFKMAILTKNFDNALSLAQELNQQDGMENGFGFGEGFAEITPRMKYVGTALVRCTLQNKEPKPGLGNRYGVRWF